MVGGGWPGRARWRHSDALSHSGLASDLRFGYTARPREGNVLLGQPVSWLGWPSSSVGRAED